MNAPRFHYPTTNRLCAPEPGAASAGAHAGRRIESVRQARRRRV
ncbi:hypothetical protein HMPREF0004_2892 [Achromobacter piechaudii ATCC 43553]|uniref:Uncharacterized protein n=1 Tax=Achromobacter piechaudii ATCC 43553 TaxID=742159 RepID=D4XBP5_9BURK|nr:hypothetical protein HMPREF0004_2892 [Achromobacter piechaudii ATCC 43553]